MINEKNIDEVWAIARDKQKLNKLASDFSHRVKTFSIDLSNIDGILEFEKILRKENPNILFLVNNAGFGKFGSYSDISIRESVNMIDLNCSGVVAMGLACIPYIKNGGHILNIASQASFQPLPYFNIYSATKAFVRNYSRALNVELKEKGISVTAVCPGWMKTSFFKRAKTRTKNDIKKLCRYDETRQGRRKSVKRRRKRK